MVGITLVRNLKTILKHIFWKNVKLPFRSLLAQEFANSENFRKFRPSDSKRFVGVFAASLFLQVAHVPFVLRQVLRLLLSLLGAQTTSRRNLSENKYPLQLYLWKNVFNFLIKSILFSKNNISSIFYLQTPGHYRREQTDAPLTHFDLKIEFEIFKKNQMKRYASDKTLVK